MCTIEVGLHTRGRLPWRALRIGSCRWSAMRRDAEYESSLARRIPVQRARQITKEQPLPLGSRATERSGLAVRQRLKALPLGEAPSSR